MSDPSERRNSERIETFQVDAGSIPLDDQNKSIITDISETGAALLVSKDDKLTSDQMRLKDISLEKSEIGKFDITGLIRWKEENFSDNHARVGLEFVYISPEIKDSLSQVIDWLKANQERTLLCETELE